MNTSTSSVSFMSSVLVVTHCTRHGLPQQGSLIAEGLRRSGVSVRVLGKSQSACGRLLEIVFYSLLLVPHHDVLLVDLFGLRAFVYEAAAILCSKFWKRRTVVVLRSGFMREFVERWPRWTRFILSQPDLVLVPHRFLQDELLPLGLRVDGIIPNFIQLQKYPFKERRVLSPRFLYLRGMHPIYNAPMALRAFALIQREYPNAELTMVGKEGQDSSHCRALVRELKLCNVRFLGLVPKLEIPCLADEHDIYLQTNRVDNMPVSIIEMWACGLPIIATHVGGVPYLIRDRHDGLLVKSEDHESMAKTCLELLTNPELAATLSRNGRARALELTWERVKPLWEAALGLDKNTNQKNGSTMGVITAAGAQCSKPNE